MVGFGLFSKKGSVELMKMNEEEDEEIVAWSFSLSMICMCVWYYFVVVINGMWMTGDSVRGGMSLTDDDF